MVEISAGVGVVVDGPVGVGEGSGESDVSIEVLADRICGLAARINVASAQLLLLLGEFDARQGWAGFGVTSCAQWLSWKCHIGGHAAREQVRVARALRDLPVVRAEFGAGRLSYAKVRAITRVACADSESDLVDLAATATAAGGADCGGVASGGVVGFSRAGGSAAVVVVFR
jgi:hypothetical protein